MQSQGSTDRSLTPPKSNKLKTNVNAVTQDNTNDNITISCPSDGMRTDDERHFLKGQCACIGTTHHSPSSNPDTCKACITSADPDPASRVLRMPKLVPMHSVVNLSCFDNEEEIVFTYNPAGLGDPMHLDPCPFVDDLDDTSASYKSSSALTNQSGTPFAMTLLMFVKIPKFINVMTELAS